MRFPSNGTLNQCTNYILLLDVSGPNSLGPKISISNPIITDPQSRIYYQPSGYFYGMDSLQFKASNILYDSVPANVTIYITHVNLPPVFTASAVTVNLVPGNERVPITIPIMDGGEIDFFSIYSFDPPSRGIWTGDL